MSTVGTGSKNNSRIMHPLGGDASATLYASPRAREQVKCVCTFIMCTLRVA